MKKYIALNVEILFIQNTDVLTESGFYGGIDEFSTPTSSSDEGLYSEG